MLYMKYISRYLSNFRVGEKEKEGGNKHIETVKMQMFSRHSVDNL